MKPNKFILHERLASETVWLCDWPLSQVLLMDDQHYPWLILVPRVSGITEITQLTKLQSYQLLDEITAASSVMQDLFKPHKLNIAALGNVVSQLHVHVIARFSNDVAWPKPVWGAYPRNPYAEPLLSERVAQLQEKLLQIPSPLAGEGKGEG